MRADEGGDAGHGLRRGAGRQAAAVAQAQGDLAAGGLPGADHRLVGDEPGGPDAGAQAYFPSGPGSESR
jgi:hypothetical protein